LTVTNQKAKNLRRKHRKRVFLGPKGTQETFELIVISCISWFLSKLIWRGTVNIKLQHSLLLHRFSWNQGCYLNRKTSPFQDCQVVLERNSKHQTSAFAIVAQVFLKPRLLFESKNITIPRLPSCTTWNLGLIILYSKIRMHWSGRVTDFLCYIW